MAVFSLFPLTALLVLIGSAISEPRDNGDCQKCKMVSDMVQGHFMNRVKYVTPSQLLDKVVSVCEKKLGEAHLKKCQKIAKENLKLIHSHSQAGEKAHNTCQLLKMC
ncbi:hypothetical protein V3C99_006648 [Haemonchus contortus]